MLKEQRLRIILDKLNKYKIIKICDLAKELKTTEMTIRRDFAYLADKDLLIRIHGGARSKDSFKEELSLSEKRTINTHKKIEIAKIIASLIKENDIVYIGPGTTNEFIYDYLDVSYAKIITNSLTIFDQFKDDNRYETILIGGSLRQRSNTFVGNFTNRMCSDMRVDLAFVGANAISDDNVMTHNEDEGICQGIMLKNAKKKYIVCDSSKFEKEDFYTFYKLNKKIVIITDSQIDTSLNNKYSNICKIKNAIEEEQ